MITLFDIPSSRNGPFSPSNNTWKVRYALNYKGLPYTTTWIEYPDIKALYSTLNIPPTPTAPYYSLPVIRDDSTNTIIAESQAIAHYLDTTYPSTPRLFPLGPSSYALHAAFRAAFESSLPSLWQFAFPPMHAILNPRSQAHFRASKEILLGKTLEAATLTGEDRKREWAKLKQEYAAVDAWIGKGKFVVGDQLSFADMEIGAFVLWLRTLLGKESEEWKDLQTWNGGRWAALMHELAKYEEVKV